MKKMDKKCVYMVLCKYYNNDCIKEVQNRCWVYKNLEGVLNKEVFKSRIIKRIYREEHGHKQYEEIKLN